MLPGWRHQRCIQKASRSLFRRLESGNLDGSFSDIIFMPFLLMLLLFGLMLALVGFWRVGSSFSTQLSAQVASVAPDQATNALSALWTAWTGKELPADAGFSEDTASRSVSTSLNADAGFNLNEFGGWQFSVSSGSSIKVHSEKFYPGQPDCDGENCNE
jgi:hypothetical protein